MNKACPRKGPDSQKEIPIPKQGVLFWQSHVELSWESTGLLGVFPFASPFEVILRLPSTQDQPLPSHLGVGRKMFPFTRAMRFYQGTLTPTNMAPDRGTRGNPRCPPIGALLVEGRAHIFVDPHPADYFFSSGPRPGTSAAGAVCGTAWPPPRAWRWPKPRRPRPPRRPRRQVAGDARRGLAHRPPPPPPPAAKKKEETNNMVGFCFWLCFFKPRRRGSPNRRNYILVMTCQVWRA